ncbi:sulfite exporter TauE/SafE family protein, partial [Vibrio parahaemolyticus]
PALLLAGIPPVEAVATNKLQSTFGTAMASWRYWKAGLVDGEHLRLHVGATIAGAALGSFVLRFIDPH